jgi:hypothetical protein
MPLPARALWIALPRLLLLAALLPLSLSSSLPLLAKSLGSPPLHVCHCEIRGGHSTCACPICHPERTDLTFTQESIRGSCGDDDLALGSSAGLGLAVPSLSSVAVLPSPVSLPPLSPSAGQIRVVTLDPPTPPPRLSAA